MRLVCFLKKIQVCCNSERFQPMYICIWRCHLNFQNVEWGCDTELARSRISLKVDKFCCLSSRAPPVGLTSNKVPSRIQMDELTVSDLRNLVVWYLIIHRRWNLHGSNKVSSSVHLRWRCGGCRFLSIGIHWEILVSPELKRCPFCWENLIFR